MIELLLSNVGYFAEGFLGNLLISALSMGLGTVLGGFIGLVRAGYGGILRALADFCTAICRNVPSFVLLFYMAFMIPNQISWGGDTVDVPIWVKAVVALTFPVIGFASDQTLAFFMQYRARISRPGETFLVAWVQYLLIIIMASAVTSVIGADEIVGRANTFIARQNDPQLLLATYCFVALWFLGAGLILSGLLKSVLWLNSLTR